MESNVRPLNGDAPGFRLFNLETMSGVFPGTRTQVYQRVRLTPIDGSGAPPCWGQILWYDDPPSCVVHRQETTNEGVAWLPVARIPAPTDETFDQQLQDALAAAGWRMEVCGTCRHWRAGKSDDSAMPPRGLCLLEQAQAAGDHTPGVLAVQSHLALRCEHWQAAAKTVGLPVDVLPSGALPLAAQTSDSKKRGWARIRVNAQKLLRRRGSARAPLAERLMERSGVGAGTEPCFVCQGRIANLAALAVESDEGDKETFSVWRCRVCFTLYLSDWVDRWERLESLETEETIYRLAPVEALAMLTIIDGVVGGDHPGRRSERNALRERIKNQIRGKMPLSHMVKQGR